MQRILGLSGRKQSGKNTACNFIVGMELISIGLVHRGICINPLGELIVGDLWGDQNNEGKLDIYSLNPDVVNFLENEVFPTVKPYSFADLLKRNVCMDVLGLTYEQCYGTDNDKNTLTSLLWENMPGIISDPGYKNFKENGVHYHAPGPMTAREVLQYVGTDVFRRMHSDVWADALIRQIKNDQTSFAVITDIRFPNEVAAVQSVGGKVIRLTRNGESTDVHHSETALDKENFDWNKFDAVLDNSKQSVGEQSDSLHQILVKWGWLLDIKK